jgi:hypothetical protein
MVRSVVRQLDEDQAAIAQHREGPESSNIYSSPEEDGVARWRLTICCFRDGLLLVKTNRTGKRSVLGHAGSTGGIGPNMYGLFDSHALTSPLKIIDHFKLVQPQRSHSDGSSPALFIASERLAEPVCVYRIAGFIASSRSARCRSNNEFNLCCLIGRL